MGEISSSSNAMFTQGTAARVTSAQGTIAEPNLASASDLARESGNFSSTDLASSPPRSPIASIASSKPQSTFRARHRKEGAETLSYGGTVMGPFLCFSHHAWNGSFISSSLHADLALN